MWVLNLADATLNLTRLISYVPQKKPWKFFRTLK